MLCTAIRAHYDKGLKTATKGTDFSMEGEEYICKIVQIYDGDTVRVAIRRRGRRSARP